MQVCFFQNGGITQASKLICKHFSQLCLFHSYKTSAWPDQASWQGWGRNASLQPAAFGMTVAVAIQSLSRVWLFVAPRTAAHQASLSFTVSWSLLKLVSSLLMKVKEESEKVVLKLNIQKTQIMASGPITSWEINGETVETVSDFIFWGSKITADGYYSHEIKKYFLEGKLWPTLRAY